MRDTFAKAVYELAQEDEKLCVLVADISPAGSMPTFRREYPDRFINVGVAEQAMIGLAAGMAQRGLKPFCYTIATFALFRPFEFIRCDLAYQNLPVTIVGMGAGLAYASLGGTHQAIEDLSVASAVPNMVVLTPSDPAEIVKAVKWCAGRKSGGPVYLRIGKNGEKNLNSVNVPKSYTYGPLRWARNVSSDTCVATYGPIAFEAQKVAEELQCDMVCVSVLKPLSAEFEKIVSVYKNVIVIEEAIGAPLGRLIAAMRGMMLRPGCNVFGFCLPEAFLHFFGTREQALDHCGLTAEKIIERLGTL